MSSQGRRTDPTSSQNGVAQVVSGPFQLSSMTEHVELEELDLFEPGGSYDNTASHVLHAIDPAASLPAENGASADRDALKASEDFDSDDGLELELDDDDDFASHGRRIGNRCPAVSIPVPSSLDRGTTTFGGSSKDSQIEEDEFEWKTLSSKDRTGALMHQKSMTDASHRTHVMDTNFGVAASVPVRSTVPLAYYASRKAAGVQDDSMTDRRPSSHAMPPLPIPPHSNSASRKTGKSDGRTSLSPAEPSRKALRTKARMEMHQDDSVEVEKESSSAAMLGTSMPIRIPMLQRRSMSATSPASIETKHKPFVPPHLLEEADETTSLGSNSPALALLSPSAAIKREKLMARNAILRSTGFIEVQPFVAPVGETIDVLKESAMPKVPMRRGKASTSSLSLALGTSK